MLEGNTGLIIFVTYAILILAVVIITRKANENSDDFLLMKRNLGVFQGSLSMAVSWIWAPAIFICSQQAYNQGLPGIFWFTFPNILTFFIFVPIALKLRKKFPKGHTISEAFRLRFNDSKAHKASLLVTLGYQLGAIVINCIAGATLISILSGIQYSTGVIMMGGLALSYSLISGLRASVLSDIVQMSMVIIIAFIIVPLAINKIGGFDVVLEGIGGFEGKYKNIFDPQIAFAFGIATSIGLIAGPVADQMFSQRAYAAKEGNVMKIFIYAGLLFGLVPIVLSLLGFIGAAGVLNGTFTINDSQMVGPEVISHLLPKWALCLFAVMAFAGLTSTLDSAFTAVGSLTSIDLLNEPESTSQKKIKVARLGMIAFSIIGISLALLQPKLLWVFLIYGAIAASLFLPTILILFWDKVTSVGVFYGILSGVIIGTPLAIFANVSENTNLIVLSSILGLLVAGIITVLVSFISSKK